VAAAAEDPPHGSLPEDEMVAFKGTGQLGTAGGHDGALDAAGLHDEGQAEEGACIVGGGGLVPLPAGQGAAALFFRFQPRAAVGAPALDVVHFEYVGRNRRCWLLVSVHCPPSQFQG
jgi:hypothetical protein